MNYYDYIAHYGVRGMKKGKRRWTNADGTLNAAGKARYGIGVTGLTSSTIKGAWKSATLHPKNISEMKKANEEEKWLSEPHSHTVGTSLSGNPSVTYRDSKGNIIGSSSYPKGTKVNKDRIDKSYLNLKRDQKYGSDKKAASRMLEVRQKNRKIGKNFVDKLLKVKK